MARVYKSAAIYDARIIGLKNLWEPSKEYMGKPVERPNYLTTVIIQKTRASWFEEPALAPFVQSCSELYNEVMSHIPFAQVVWPIRDGDVQDPARAAIEWGRGHWILNGSSSTPIEVSIVQNNVPVLLPKRLGVKPGDKVAVTTVIAQKGNNDPRGVKCYINKVMFTGPGEEIVIGNSISNADLMAQAKAQGLNVTGFGSGGAPQQGFPPPAGGFTTPPSGGFAQTPVNPATSFPAPAPSGTPNSTFGNASFPSNGPQGGLAPSPVSPPSQQGFGIPGEFRPSTGFPQR